MADDISYEDGFSFPSLWDQANIGGELTPGLCKITGAKRSYEWDKKKGKGTAGAHSTFQGDNPATFTMTLRMWTSAHRRQWEKIRAILSYKQAKKVEALGFLHPATMGVGIAAVDVEDIGAVEFPKPGLATVVCTFCEHKFPKPSPATTPSSTKNAKKANPPAKAREQSLEEMKSSLEAALKP